MTTLIDLSSVTRVGNMTGGGGLSGIMDGSTSTVGYAESTSGYVGVDFGVAPKRIHSAEIVSASNGFDASGSTTGITLSLYARNDRAPTFATDGVRLAETTFTDVNAVTTKTLTSRDNNLKWRYVWVAISTGVWSIASELRLYEYVPPAAVEPSAPSADRAVYKKTCTTKSMLPKDAAAIADFAIDLCIVDASVAEIDAYAATTHCGEFTGYNGAIGIGMLIGLKFSETWAGLDAASVAFPQITTGNNISERNPDHYSHLSLHSAVDLAPGFHRVMVYMTGHTDASGYSNLNGLAALLVEGSQGLNCLRVSVDKTAALVAL